MQKSRQWMHVGLSLGVGERSHGGEDYLQFSKDFEGWMNLNEREMIDNVFWLKEVGCGIYLLRF